MKTVTLSFLLLISIIFLFSCSEDSSTSHNAIDKNYLPLKVGASWEYRRMDVQRPIFYYRENIIQEESIGYYKTRMIFADESGINAIIDTFYYKMTNEGLMIFDKTKFYGDYILKKPYEVGDYWTTQVNDTLLKTYAIVDDDVTLETFAGTFPGCITVHSWYNADTTDYSEYIYAPNVGCIKRLDYFLDSYNIP